MSAQHIAKKITTSGNVSTAGELLVRRNINRPLTNRFALLLSPSAMVYLGEFQNSYSSERTIIYEPASPLLPQSVNRPLFSGCFYLKLGIQGVMGNVVHIKNKMAIVQNGT